MPVCWLLPVSLSILLQLGFFVYVSLCARLRACIWVLVCLFLFLRLPAWLYLSVSACLAVHPFHMLINAMLPSTSNKPRYIIKLLKLKKLREH